MIKINIITRCTRVDNLLRIYESIKTNIFDIVWYIVFDTSIIKNIDIELLQKLQSIAIVKFDKTTIENDHGHDLINKILDEINDGYVYILDDDNILHENFYENINVEIENDKMGYLFNQDVDYKDFTNSKYRIIDPNNIKVGHIDMAQFLLDRKLIGNYRIPTGNYTSDGMFIERIFSENKEKFKIVDKTLSYYNFLEKEKNFFLPKVLFIGLSNPIIESIKLADYIDNRLNVKYINDKDNILESIKSFNPDCIISSNGVDSSILNGYSSDIRQRWIFVEENDPNIGQYAYNCAMNYILNNNINDLISFITPTYNTGDKIQRLYESILNQTYPNWEWVIVDDSNDNGKTLQIINEISKNDPRVIVYDFNNKSGGFIGESKYRGFCLSKGNYLAEVDHDDYLMPTCAKDVVDAFKSNNDVGFVYSDCCEIDENLNSHRYPDGFALGYGKYRKEMLFGKEIDVVIQQNINPKTIRHIVGVPNHIRVWKRDIYFKIGGHCRRLSIADDYELIVRTFLNTKMMHIPKNLYLQFIYNNNTGRNTHDLTRADIQRRVHTIALNYNEDIQKRFIELGLEDWAYKENPNNPLLSENRFGDDENHVNLTYKKEEN